MDDDGLIGGCARKRTVGQNLNMIAPPNAQTAMRGLIANPSKEHLFAPQDTGLLSVKIKHYSSLIFRLFIQIFVLYNLFRKQTAPSYCIVRDFRAITCQVLLVHLASLLCAV